MRAGRLNHRITVQEVYKQADGMGGYQEVWQDYLHAWADIRPIDHKEREWAMQISSRISHRVHLRYREGITPGMVVRYGDRILEIASVINVDEADRELILYCEEVIS